MKARAARIGKAINREGGNKNRDGERERGQETDKRTVRGRNEREKAGVKCE